MSLFTAKENVWKTSIYSLAFALISRHQIDLKFLAHISNTQSFRLTYKTKNKNF